DAGHLRVDLVTFEELGHPRGGDGGHRAYRRRQGAIGDWVLHGGAPGATGAAVGLRRLVARGHRADRDRLPGVIRRPAVGYAARAGRSASRHADRVVVKLPTYE